MSLSTVDKVLNHSLVNLTAQLEVIHEDVLHGDRLKDLKEFGGGGGSIFQICFPKDNNLTN